MIKPAGGARAKKVPAKGPAPDPTTPEPTITAPVDPRAVRVAVVAASRTEGDPTMTVSPPPLPVLRRLDHLAGTAILGGIPAPPDIHRVAPDGAAAPRPVRRLIVDGEPVDLGLERLDPEHVVLAESSVAGPIRSRVILGPERRREADGLLVRELVIDGWRVVVELEPERRASLRERARRASDVAGRGGPVEVRAIIPGRIVALSVGPGDPVTAGQQVLVLEAMKMQNELRAPREGVIERIPIAVGEKVEVGDLLMVIT